MKGTRPRPMSESSVHGIIVSGEASESDEEFDEIIFAEEEFTNIDSPTKASLKKPLKSSPSQKPPQYHKSLLHQKLFEANVLLHKSITKQTQEPLSENSFQLSKLQGRLITLAAKTTASHVALSKAQQNIGVLLDQLSKLDGSRLPNVKSNTNT